MTGKFLLGVDIGTGETKATLTDLKGNIVATAARAHELISPEPGFAEHDPINHWVKDFIEVKDEVLLKAGGRPEDIAAIGISAIMAAVTFCDENYAPLRNAILYGVDTRCVKQIEEINERIGEDRMIKLWGSTATVDHFGPKILWVRENQPEIWEKTKHITFDAGYLVARLTGVNVVDYYSVKAAVPMLNWSSYEWYDNEYCRMICEPEVLPDIAGTYDVAGKVTKKAAEEFGLAEGTVVTCGTTDAGAEAVSVGVLKGGDTMLMYGSTAFIVAAAELDPANEQLTDYRYTIKGLKAGTAGMATTGSLTKWIKNTMGKDLVAAEEAGGENAFAALFKEAEGIGPGSDGLIVLPYFQGERYPIFDPQAKGVMFGLRLGHTRGHIMHAVFEGIGYGIDQNMQVLKNNGYPPVNVTAVGGGTKSPLWIQTVSDICGFAQKVPEITIGASYGDAMMAGLALGSIESVDEIAALIKIKYVAEPDAAKHEQYKEYKELYRELYERNKDIMHIL